jgi:hypothetical protein
MNRAFQIGLAIVVLLFGAIGSIYYFVYRSGQDNGEMRVADQSPSLSQPQIDGMDAEPAGDMGDAVAELDARLLSEAFDVSFTRCGESAPTPNVFCAIQLIPCAMSRGVPNGLRSAMPIMRAIRSSVITMVHHRMTARLSFGEHASPFIPMAPSIIRDKQ